MSGPKYYILKGKTPVVEHDVLRWGRWMENQENRRVAFTEQHGVHVSTVFLGLDHGWGLGRVVLFETMALFDVESWEIQERCSTWKEAEAQHTRVCEKAFGKAKSSG